MKIRENSDEGGKERLGEQENKANRALKATERGSGVPRRREREPKRVTVLIGGGKTGPISEARAPPLSILDTKIQRKHNRRN